MPKQQQKPATIIEETPFTGFPTRENCDLENPRQAFLWMLVALPGMRGAQMLMPVAYNQLVSEHLWKCGARPAADPVIKYQPPQANDPHWLTSPGRWVPLDAPEPPESNPARRALNGLTPMQKAELLKQLLEESAAE